MREYRFSLIAFAVVLCFLLTAPLFASTGFPSNDLSKDRILEDSEESVLAAPGPFVTLAFTGTITEVGDESPVPDDIIDTMIDTVDALVSSGILKAGVGNSLTVKLENAIDHLDRGNLHAASQVLGAFINEVEALVRSGILPEEEGQELIALAQEVIESLAFAGVVVGDSWTLTYTFDAATMDVHPDSEMGLYYNPITDMTLTIGSTTVSGTPGVAISGGYSSQIFVNVGPWDYADYSVSVGLPDTSAWAQVSLCDNEGTPFADDSLPLSIPTPLEAEFPTYRYFRLREKFGTGIRIEGTVEDIVLPPDGVT